VIRFKLYDLMKGATLNLDDPHILDIRMADIPETVAAAIMNIPGNCVAVSLRDDGGKAMRKAAEGAAMNRGVRLLWVKSRAHINEG